MSQPNLTKSQEAFDAVATSYDAWFDANPHAYASELEALRRFFPATGDRLEVGIGTGRFAEPLGISLGVEPSSGMAAIARGRGIEVVEGIAQALPFPEGRFDAVLICTVFCFVKELEPVLAEAFRVLREGGTLVLAELDLNRPLVCAYDAHKDKDPLYRHASFHTADEFSRALGAVGFRIEERCQTIFGDPTAMPTPDPVKPGHGEGAFIVFKARKGR